MAAIDINHFARSYEGTVAQLATRLAMAEAEAQGLREQLQTLEESAESLAERLRVLEKDEADVPSQD